MWGYDHMGGGFFGGGFMFIWWILIIIALVWLVKWIFGQSSGPGNSGGARKNPRDILDERYARGEIEREEYEQKKKDLEN